MENQGGIMGKVLHPCTTTTRRKIQNSQKEHSQISQTIRNSS